MYQQFFFLALFLAALACLPFLIRWLKVRIHDASNTAVLQNRIISAIAVGPHQKVVTVEVGPQGDRIWLTLGVGANGITCLHTTTAPAEINAPVGNVVTTSQG